MVFVFIVGLFLVDLVYGNSLSRIIGGSDVSLRNHPYIVSLQNDLGAHACAGSIVATQWILTAGHCVQTGDASKYKISLNDGTFSGGSTAYDVQTIYKHPNYNVGDGTYPNDVALLKLKTPMDFTTFGHRPVSLANSFQNFDESICVISGWGYTVGGDSDSVPNRLQQTSGTVLSSAGCISSWNSHYNEDAHICIHDNDFQTGSCNGDNGGPMVCNGVLAGVASWGRYECDTSYPSVYARVSTYRQWIDDTIEEN